jgi:general secretion pathway protein G
VSDAYRDGEEGLRARLDDLSWQRELLFDKRLETDRELACIQREINALERSFCARAPVEGGYWWLLAVPVGVLGLVWATGALYFCSFRHPRAEVAKVGAEAVRQAAELFINTEDVDECPSIDQLVAAKKIDARKTDDPWGQRYYVACVDDQIRVRSAGKDGRFYTPDDIRDDFKPSEMKLAAELND